MKFYTSHKTTNNTHHTLNFNINRLDPLVTTILDFHHVIVETVIEEKEFVVSW